MCNFIGGWPTKIGLNRTTSLDNDQQADIQQNVGVSIDHYIHLYTISTAQGGGGSFTIGNLYERLVIVNHGWQSEPTDGSKGGWSVGLSICPSIYLAI